jgi:hypothetical protein
MKDLPSEMIVQIQNHTGYPWWNGQAYAEYRGYPQAIWRLKADMRCVADDLEDVIQWLRAEQLYAHADRLRTIQRRARQASDIS